MSETLKKAVETAQAAGSLYIATADGNGAPHIASAAHAAGRAGTPDSCPADSRIQSGTPYRQNAIKEENSVFGQFQEQRREQRDDRHSGR